MKRSTTRLLMILSACGASLVGLACGDETCGPGDAPVDGLRINSADLLTAGGIAYGDATTSPNNDCSIDQNPNTPTSLTIDIAQVSPATASRRALILCVPRPDMLDQQLALTTDSELTGVQVIDIFADDNSDDVDCLISLDRTRDPVGTADFTGACSGGNDLAGYALRVDGEIPAISTCNGTATPITLTIAGEIAVRALDNSL